MSTQHLAAVIGAGPAGIYGARKLTEAGHRVLMINRDIKFGGLAEYGIFLDKEKMKTGLRKQFQRIMANEKISYLGHVMVGNGQALTIQDLQDIGFSAIVVSAGAQGTKKLGLPGEDLTGVYHAKDVVYHYNKLPPFSQRNFEIGKKVAIIGMGNVMVDVNGEHRDTGLRKFGALIGDGAIEWASGSQSCPRGKTPALNPKPSSMRP